MMNKYQEAKKIGFKDGVLTMYAPPEFNIPKAKFFYEDYKVGVKRFYSALLAGVEVAKCVRIPQSTVAIDGTETVVINNSRYFIKQIQYDDETMPKTLILTLTKTS